LLTALHEIRLLPPASFADSQWEVLSALMALLPFAAVQLKLVFQREGKVDFTEIAHASRDALGTPDNPTDLAFSMDCRIQHLLVDEFQDTSHGQYELLKALTAEWLPGDGRTLFLVGDPMQSIYGFREAEVALFLKARQHGLGNIQLTPLQLSVNFRSSAGIVNWVNDALGPAFPLLADRFTGAVTYAPSTSFHSGKVDTAVHFHPSFEKDHTVEAEKVVSIIAESRQQNSTARIAVLVRARTHLVAIVEELRHRKIPFQAVDIDSLGARPIALDLQALTLALLNPADRLSWLAILRAPWCGLTLADLHALAGNDPESIIWDLLNDESRLSSVSVEGRSRIERVRSVLAASMEQRGRLPLRRWVEATWIALGGPAALENKTGLNDASVFLDLLESSAAGADLRDPERFLKNVESLFARPDVEANENLQLLTIHKAKGLEFDTVIIPGLGRNPRGDDRRLLRWLEFVDASERPQLLLAPIKETGTKDDSAYAYVRKIENQKADNESVRLLYVAATRAKSHLHLFGHTEFDFETRTVKRPGSRTLLNKFWDTAGSIFESAAATLEAPSTIPAAEAVPAMPPAGPSLRRFRSGWQAVAAPPDVRWSADSTGATSVGEAAMNEPITFEWASDLPRRVGIVVHAMLQQVDGSGSLELQRSRISAALVAEGLHGERLREGITRVEQALRATAMDDRGRWILAKHLEDQREYALCGVVGGHVRYFTLDRTFVDDGIRWIIDYKTGSHEGGNLETFLDSEQERYRPQLENYARLMSRLDPRPIRMGLYFPMLQAWREWA
jgi:ATP-dependent exoDNAse (exonuclease V) beta subunit